jgi:hypothetical protein
MQTRVVDPRRSPSTTAPDTPAVRNEQLESCSLCFIQPFQGRRANVVGARAAEPYQQRRDSRRRRHSLSQCGSPCRARRRPRCLLHPHESRRLAGPPRARELDEQQHWRRRPKRTLRPAMRSARYQRCRRGGTRQVGADFADEYRGDGIAGVSLRSPASLSFAKGRAPPYTNIACEARPEPGPPRQSRLCAAPNKCLGSNLGSKVRASRRNPARLKPSKHGP